MNQTEVQKNKAVFDLELLTQLGYEFKEAMDKKNMAETFQDKYLVPLKERKIADVVVLPTSLANPKAYPLSYYAIFVRDW